MKIFTLFLLILTSLNAFSQSFNKPLKVQPKAPINALHHKFSTIQPAKSEAIQGPILRNCLTTEINVKLQEKYGLPDIPQFEEKFSRHIKQLRTSRTKATVVTLPIIVHVIHNGENIGTGANISAAQVYSQIDVLNEDFRRKEGTMGHNTHPNGADVEIEFAPALIDENGNMLAEPGIHRVNGNRTFWEDSLIQANLKPQTIWNPEKYVNIWTLKFGGENAGILGYAQFPNLSGLAGLMPNQGLASTDGVVIGYEYFGRVGNLSATYNGGRTTTHEIGHWLGLRHIWGDGDCSADDFCEDTPNAAHSNYTCKAIDSCPLDDLPDMIENYMDYTDDACMNVFTQNQKERMRTVLQISPRRRELLNSDVHLALQRPVAFFNANKNSVCSGETIEFTDASTNTPTNWQWTFFDSDDNEVGNFTNKDISITFNGIGVYGLQLIVSNSFGADTIYQPNYVSVFSGGQLSFPFSENFENSTPLDQWVFYNPDGDRTWQTTDVAGTGTGSQSMYMDNYSVTDEDPSGTYDAIFSPKIDLSQNQNSYLTFDVAYAKYGRDYTDTLAIYISTDCGANFDLIWYKGGDDLATQAPTEDSYVPADQGWVTESISLKAYNGLTDVHIAIVNWSGWGNNLYLDNINIQVPFSTEASNPWFFSPNDTITVGTTVAFADYSTNYPTQWFWEFEGGTPSTASVQNPYVTYNTIGTFDVRLYASNSVGGNERILENYITVIGKPDITITSNKTDNTVCQGDSIMLVASGGQFYKWYDDRGYNISDNDTLVVIPQVNTFYSVEGEDIYGGKTTATVSVNVASSPEFDLGEDITIDISESMTLDVGETFFSYLWNDNSTSKTLEVKASDYGIGTHLFHVTVTNASGCSATDSISVTIEEQEPLSSEKELTSFAFMALNPTVEGSIMGQQLELTVPAETDVTTLVATFAHSEASVVTIGNVVQQSGVTANDFTNPVVYTVTAEDGSTKNYTVTVIVTEELSDGKELLSFGFQQLDEPVAGNITGQAVEVLVPFGTDVTALVASFTHSDLSEVWINSAQQVSGTTANNFTSPVIYTVIAEDESFQNYLVTVTIDAPTGIKDSVLSQNELRLFPNPFDHQIITELKTPDNQPVTITISDLSGKIVLSSLAFPANGKLYEEIPTSHIKPGTYILIVNTGNGQKMQKIIKVE